MEAGWRTVRVFISSTFKDMQAERDHLVRFVFPRLREELLKRRIHLADVDLRWGVTAEQDALEVCREIIDECRPRFICILGGRYGWVPPGADRSITADEVHYAAVEDPDRDLYQYFYFRDPEATACIPEDAARAGGYREFATDDDIEKHGEEQAEVLAGQRTQRLGELKKKVEDVGLPVFEYPCDWDAERQRLVGLEAFGQRVYQDLMDSVDDELGEEVPEELDWFAEENAAMEAFVEERTQRYVVGSRQALLDEMTEFAEGGGEPRVLAVTGEPGSGKSALLGKFYRDYAEAHPDEIIIPHFVGASQGSTSIRETLRRLCHELAQAAGIEDEVPEDIKELVQAFPEFLARAAGVAVEPGTPSDSDGGLEARPTRGAGAGARRVVIIIDALNQFDAADNVHTLNWLPRQLPGNVRVIVSSLEHASLDALRRREQQVGEVVCGPLELIDVHRIVRAFLDRYHKTFDWDQRHALLMKTDTTLPLYILVALEELRTLGTYEEITARIEELPGRTTELFDWILRRLEAGVEGQEAFGEGLVSAYTSYIAIGRGGMTEGELEALCEPGDEEDEFWVLHRMLRPYLMQRGELADYFHNQLRQAAERRYLADDAARQQRHRDIAEHLQGCAYHYRRTLSELPHHLAHGAMSRSLINVLTDVEFVAAKVGANMLHELIEECGPQASTDHCPEVSANPDLAQVRTFLQQHASVLQRHPQNVVQQALLADQPAVSGTASRVDQRGAILRPSGYRPLPRSETKTLAAHTRAVCKCQFLSEGTRIASCGQDGRFVVHETRSLREEWSMVISEGPCYDFAASPDETLFWVCADSGLYLCDSSDLSRTRLLPDRGVLWTACYRPESGAGTLLGSACGRLALLPDGREDASDITRTPMPIGEWLLSDEWCIGLPVLSLQAFNVCSCSVQKGTCDLGPTESAATAGALCPSGNQVALAFMDTRIDATVISSSPDRHGRPHTVREFGRSVSRLELRDPDLCVTQAQDVDEWMLKVLTYSRGGACLCGAGMGHMLHLWCPENLTRVGGIRTGGAEAVCIDMDDRLGRVAVGDIDGALRLFEQSVVKEAGI